MECIAFTPANNTLATTYSREAGQYGLQKHFSKVRLSGHDRLQRSQTIWILIPALNINLTGKEMIRRIIPATAIFTVSRCQIVIPAL